MLIQHPIVCFQKNTPQKTQMTMEKQPFEDVSPIKNGDFPASHVSFRGCISIYPKSTSNGAIFCGAYKKYYHHNKPRPG